MNGLTGQLSGQRYLPPKPGNPCSRPGTHMKVEGEIVFTVGGLPFIHTPHTYI